MMPNPIPAGSRLNTERALKQPDRPPRFPPAWTATVLLSPFGDAVSPLPNGSQLLIARIECSSGADENWMRVTLYLTQDQRLYEFVFVTAEPDSATEERHWYWIDANASESRRPAPTSWTPSRRRGAARLSACSVRR